jgi:hypothetical protein
MEEKKGRSKEFSLNIVFLGTPDTAFGTATPEGPMSNPLARLLYLI